MEIGILKGLRLHSVHFSLNLGSLLWHGMFRHGNQTNSKTTRFRMSVFGSSILSYILYPPKCFILKNFQHTKEFFFKLYCIDYMMTVVPVFLPFPLPPSTPPLTQAIPTLFMSRVMHKSSLATSFPVLYFTFP